MATSDLSTTTTSVGLTTTTYALTPQAKDDYFTVSEDGSIQLFDVMANDLGGKAKTLYSIDDGVEDLTSALADILYKDQSLTGVTDLSTVVVSEYSQFGAGIAIVNGKVLYNTTTAAFQSHFGSLAAGEFGYDSITYTIRLSNGTLSTGSVTIRVVGTNDAPIIDSAAQSGSITETADSAPLADADPTDATGTITFDDVDLSDSPTASILPGASVTGGTAVLSAAQVAALLDNLSLGAVTDNPDGSGSVGWTYSVPNTEIDFLGEGETVELTFTVEINDGNGGTDTQDVVITITGTNDAPVIEVDGAATYTTGGPPVGIDSTITITDVDDTTLTGAAISISGNFQSGDVLNFVNQAGITGIYNAGTGVLTLSGSASLAAYETAIESITFSTTSSNTATRTISYTVNDGTANSATDTATVNVVVGNVAPVISAPALLYWSAVNSGILTPINRISFQDVDSSTVRVTLTMDDTGDVLTAASGLGVTVAGSGSSSITLDGTLAAINAFLFAGSVQWDPQGGNNQETGQLTITIDDNGTGPLGNVVSTTVSISEFIPSFGGSSSNDLSTVNLDDITTDPDGANNNDTLVTSWSHQPSATTVLYDGGAGTDIITLVFTPDQLAEILANSAFRSSLTDYLDGTPGTLDLDASSWNADATAFEVVNVSLATGYGNGTLSINSIMMPVPPVDATPDTDADLVLGTGGAESLNGGANPSGNDVLVGLGGNDTLGGADGNDLLLGGDGDDVLTGATGIDVLSGSRGADTYVFGAGDNTAANADSIVDYSFVEGDKINLADLLDAGFNPGDNIADFVRVQQSGSNILVQVDANGGGDSFETVATLVNYGTSGLDPVRVTFESVDHVLTV